jgi:hypothetical protein
MGLPTGRCEGVCGGVSLGMGVSDAVDVCLQGEWLGAHGYCPMCGLMVVAL